MNRVLWNEPHAAVKMPTFKKAQNFKSAFKTHNPRLHNVYCVTEGLKLILEQARDVVIQNLYCNGWHHDHHVGSVLMFAPSGLIIAFDLNEPGCMHYSAIENYGNIYERLVKVFETTGGRCVVDFASNRVLHSFAVKSGQDHHRNSDYLEYLRMAREETSARNPEYWGMRAI